MPRRFLLLLCSFLLALLPLYLNFSRFKRLFFFGDELVSLSEMRVQGFWPWVLSVFAESSVPVFKFLWGGAVIAFGGSYTALVGLVWATHAINAGLLCLILSHVRAALPLQLLGIALFAITPGTHESLGWTIQWCPVLACTFFLLGFYLLLTNLSLGIKVLGVFVCAALAAFSFARGILVCGILSFGLYMIVRRRPLAGRLVAILPMIPALAAVEIIFIYSGGNHQNLAQAGGDVLEQMISFGGTFYLLNPLYRIFFDLPPDLNDFLVFGSIKLGLVAAALVVAWRSKDEVTRLLIIAPLLFDLGNALLLALGRYHTGWVFALSSRYQYESLFCMSITMVVLASRITRWPRMVNGIATAAFLIVVSVSLTRWHDLMPHWATYRGKEGRRFFFGSTRVQPPATWIGLPGILSKEEAVETIKTYNLH